MLVKLNTIDARARLYFSECRHAEFYGFLPLSSPFAEPSFREYLRRGRKLLPFHEESVLSVKSSSWSFINVENEISSATGVTRWYHRWLQTIAIAVYVREFEFKRETEDVTMLFYPEQTAGGRGKERRRFVLPYFAPGWRILFTSACRDPSLGSDQITRHAEALCFENAGFRCNRISDIRGLGVTMNAEQYRFRILPRFVPFSFADVLPIRFFLLLLRNTRGIWPDLLRLALGRGPIYDFVSE